MSTTTSHQSSDEPIELLFDDDDPSTLLEDGSLHDLSIDGDGGRPHSPLRKQARAWRRRTTGRLGRFIPAWLRRRAWLLVAAALAGALGGLSYGMVSTPSYSAEATLAVPAGATASQPGSANEAQALAISYAAIVQQDDTILAPAAHELGLTVDGLTRHLNVSVQTGTSVLVLRYTAPSSTEAVRGVNAIADAIVNHKIHSSIVPLNTVEVVQLATSASESGVLARYGLPIGLFLGLLVGLIIALIAERLDPRADRSNEIGEVFGLPVATVPSELSVPEFGHAVLSAKGAKHTMTLAPLRWWDVPASYSIERTLAPDHPDTTISVSRALEAGMAHRLDSNSELVLVVRSGEHMQAIGDALERLRLTGRTPAWIALLDRDDLYD
ncbi:MAG TPA: Wzz/FepE/Etk N-terminal domain-containing protein [Acidimicrobiales bacterium]|jgi:capsular polysaccharide biosynthesis protein|nr:Wzz/FepE/Etk N-terminal domain-containing protein [Acidimicrobiales bacterium]